MKVRTPRRHLPLNMIPWMAVKVPAMRSQIEK